MSDMNYNRGKNVNGRTTEQEIVWIYKGKVVKISVDKIFIISYSVC